MKVRVHPDKCVAAGTCVAIAPEVFDQREEDGIVILLTDSPSPETHEAVRESAMSCPSWAIDVDEA